MTGFNSRVDAEIVAEIADRLDSDPRDLSLQTISGGAQSVGRFLVSVSGRHRALLKCGGDAHSIASETIALRSLAEHAPDAIVPVLAAGGDPPFLAVRWLEQRAPNRQQMYSFGSALAELHRSSQQSGDSGDRWGFDVDNWLGGTLQRNSWEGDAVTFIARHRIGQQQELLSERGAGAGFLHRLDRLVDRLPGLLGRSSRPCLLHGDLWSGNVLLDGREESAVVRVIDPAPWWGPREAELGMTRLFGGLPHHDAFWRGYSDRWPLDEHSEQRIVLFELYHLLNHWTLFGSSYRASCEERLTRLRI